MKSALPCLLIALCVMGASSQGDKRPHFIQQPPARLLWPTTRGAVASCKASGHPPPEIQWVTAEGQVLTTIPGLRHVLRDGRLVLGARRSTEAGALRCRAANRAGVALSRPLVLQPVEDSVLTFAVRQLSPARAGGAAVLRCDLPPQLSRARVDWMQDGLPLPSGYMATDGRWVTGVGGLLLGTDLTPSDLQAEYICVAAHTPSQPLRLTTDESSWLESVDLSAVEATAGDAVLLPCLLRRPAAHAVSWLRQEASGAWAPAEGFTRGGALVLAAVRSAHAGRYACHLGAEASRLVIRLVVYEPLVVTVAPNPLLLATGATGHLNCSAAGGRGGAALSWHHEGRALHAPPPLAVGPARAHHAGLYQCTATDHVDAAVGEAEVVIADRAPQLVATFNEATTRVGQTVTLRCAASGAPAPRVLWTLDERPLPAAADKYSVNTRAELLPGSDDGAIVSTLSVTVRTPEEGGRYTCNATNLKGSQAHSARLNVFGPPNIRYLPTIHVKADTDVVLHCPYSGYPIKEVSWRREDGAELDAGAGATLRLPAGRHVAGAFTCDVRSDSGELARRTVKIEVHKPPKITPFTFPEELEIGGSTQATCSLISGDKPIQFIWLKDNYPIPSVLKVELKNMAFFTILIIQELTAAHNGDYTCRAANDFGVVSHSATLTVKEPPSWVWRAGNTSVSAGAAALLPCAAAGQPAPAVVWDFSNDNESWRTVPWAAPADGDGDGAVLPDGAVWLRAARPEHEGWYRCTARAPHAAIHHTFFLDVREPARVSRAGGGAARWVTRGAGARLACAARGEPDLRVHWTHDGRPVQAQGGVEARESRAAGALLAELYVARAAPDHAGEYRCHAANLYGSDELAFRLYVKERPSTPEEVRISEVWTRRARVTWREPRAPVAHYTLQARRLAPALAPAAPLDVWAAPDVINFTVAAPDLLHIASEGPGRAGAIISELSPDTRYALRLAASNDVGESSYTLPLHFTTREEAPGGAPRDISVRALKPRELHVTWQPPPADTWHGTLLGYTVRWWEVGESQAEAGAAAESGAGAEAAGATLRGLRPAARYAVAVRAYNSAGAGPASAPHYRHTLESPPASGPEGVSCSAHGPTSLRVSWRAPAAEARGGVLTHYTLQYTRADVDALTPTQDAYLRVQGEDTTVSRLVPYAEYEIRVRAHNAAGDGPLTAPLLCRTDEDVPGAPGGMKLVALSERSLRAAWLPPPEPNGRVTHYTLYLKDLSGSQEPNVTRVTSCSDGAGGAGGAGGVGGAGGAGGAECARVVRGLRAGRTYEAWARAATAVGEGPPSAAVACQTSSLAPARITSFGGRAVGAAGSALSLRCAAGGAPPPARRWLRAGAPLHARPPFHLDGDALLIRSLELSHADNYTCVAENAHGTDSVTWRVAVLRPPAAPTLLLLEARARELQLELRPAPRVLGHAAPRGYTLHWRLVAPEGEWRSQPASPGPVTLSSLRCGSAYRAYAAAGGSAGTELGARTAGGPPAPPPDARWIRTNETHASFDTAAWGDGGCGPVALRLEWAGSGAAGARDVPVSGEVILGGLSAGSRYRVAARAANEAGWAREVYELATAPAPDAGPDAGDAPFPATPAELAVLLALCAMLSVAALTILAILLRRKRGEGAAARATSGDKPGCGTYRAAPHPAPKLPPDPPDVYEISPYATFAGPPSAAGARAYTLQLRALARHDDEAAPPAPPACCDVEETCVDAREGGRRRRRRRHYCPDHGCSQDSGS